jgi:tetratricopeptide (TPR) repeat protein
MSLTSQLNSLESANLLQIAATGPELEYLFRHELVQNTAYQSLVKADRRLLHASVAEVIEHAYAGRLDDVAATLAHHFERAEAHERAVPYLIRAGDRARAAYANAEALQFYQAALRQLDHLPGAHTPAGEWLALASAVHEHAGDVLMPVGQIDEARQHFETALALAGGAEPIRRAGLHRKIGNTWDEEHDLDQAHRAYHAAEAVLDREPLEPAVRWWREWVRLRLDQMMEHYWRGEWQQIAQLAEETRPAVERYGTASLRARFFDRLSGIYIQRDHYVFSDETMEVVTAMLAAANESGDLIEQTNAEFSVGFGRLWRGELEQAEAHLHAALALAERIGNVTYLTWSLTYLAVLWRKRGQVEETRRYVARAMKVATAGQFAPWIGVGRANLAWAAGREGRWAEAQAEAEAALERWRPLAVVLPFRWLLLWPLAGLALANDRLPQALDHAREMLEPGQQPLPVEMRSAIEQALAGWQRGESEAAHKHISRAAEAARALGYL